MDMPECMVEYARSLERPSEEVRETKDLKVGEVDQNLLMQLDEDFHNLLS